MSDTAPPDLRILVGAGSYADAAAAFRLVGRLADTFRAKLGGILVEEHTADLCQIPNQRVVQTSGTTMLAPSLAQVSTLIEADARAFRKSLAIAAHPRRAHWIFAQERGDLVDAALQAAADWDVLIIGYRQVHKMRGKIVLLGDPSPCAGPMETIAAQLSDQLNAERVSFVIEDAPKLGPSAGIRFDTLDEILIALSRLNTESVLLDLRQGPVKTQSDLARILEAARCPVIVFGTATKQALLAHSIQVPPVSTA